MKITTPEEWDGTVFLTEGKISREIANAIWIPRFNLAAVCKEMVWERPQ